MPLIYNEEDFEYFFPINNFNLLIIHVYVCVIQSQIYLRSCFVWGNWSNIARPKTYSSYLKNKSKHFLSVIRNGEQTKKTQSICVWVSSIYLVVQDSQLSLFFVLQFLVNMAWHMYMQKNLDLSLCCLIYLVIRHVVLSANAQICTKPQTQQ
jgi:hypothetical protein